MVWSIFIDESGNPGKQGRYFVMAAILVRDNDILKRIRDVFPKKREEPKFYNSNPDEIAEVLTAVSKSDSNIVYVSLDKHTKELENISPKKMYVLALEELIKKSMRFLEGRDVIVSLDNTRLVSAAELNRICRCCADEVGCNFIRCNKPVSKESYYIQFADYVVGALRSHIEFENSHYYNIIKQKLRSP